MNYKIMIVEDDPDIAELVSRHLEKFGFTIEKCIEFHNVLKEFEKAKPHLVLLDIKHSDPAGHVELTGRKQEAVLQFMKALERAEIPVVIRHVVVPGITDSEKELTDTGHLIGGLRNLVGLEILPYHTMGINKYKNMGKEYPLEGVPEMKPEQAKKARMTILRAIQEVRRNL